MFPLEYPRDIKIIIFFEKGRLGNQIFQYAAIKKIAPRAVSLFIGLENLKIMLEKIDIVEESKAWNIPLRILTRLGRSRLARMAGKGKFLTLISERHQDKQSIVIIEKGRFFPSIAVLHEAYFQDEAFSSDINRDTLAIRKTALIASSKWLRDNTKVLNKHLYFVHVRRGDYIRWPSEHEPAVLPLSWYVSQMNKVREYDCNAHFIVFTDDYPYTDEMLGDQADVLISRQSEVLDLATMSLCTGGGILSASSFAWWAAYYIRVSNPNAILLAPLHWAGWRKAEWYPPCIETSWLNYIQVV